MPTHSKRPIWLFVALLLILQLATCASVHRRVPAGESSLTSQKRPGSSSGGDSKKPKTDPQPPTALPKITLEDWNPAMTKSTNTYDGPV